jgi:probable F420-dependent oxidoreductase
MRIGVTAFLTDLSPSPGVFAAACEERGYSSLYLPEHTHLPVAEDRPPALVAGVDPEDYRRSLDPFVALAAASAVTQRIRLGTGVCLVAQRDPVVLAKEVATLDQLCGGRFVLGVGYGWNRQEAADHGVVFSRRRQVAAEKLACMQALWRDDPASFSGTHVKLPPCHAWPKPVQRPRVRTLLGAGPSERTFAAVAALADGWMPMGGAGLAASLPRLRRAVEEAGRPAGSVEVVVFGTVPDPGKLDHYRALGVDEVVLRVPSRPEKAMLEALDAATRYLVGATGGD